MTAAQAERQVDYWRQRVVEADAASPRMSADVMWAWECLRDAERRLAALYEAERA